MSSFEAQNAGLLALDFYISIFTTYDYSSTCLFLWDVWGSVRFKAGWGVAEQGKYSKE